MSTTTYRDPRPRIEFDTAAPRDARYTVTATTVAVDPDADWSKGAVVQIRVVPAVEVPELIPRELGGYEGQIAMAPDFDAPLDFG